MQQKEVIYFERIAVANRWKQRRYSRSCDWVVFGIATRWAGPESFCWKLCFFGIDIQVWLKRVFL